MKKIFNRRSGKNLTLEEAKSLAQKVKKLFPDVQYDDHRAVNGYPTDNNTFMLVNLHNIADSRPGHIFAFYGSEYMPFEGYKAHTISFVSLPTNFEEKFPDYVIIG